MKIRKQNTKKSQWKWMHRRKKNWKISPAFLLDLNPGSSNFCQIFDNSTFDLFVSFNGDNSNHVVYLFDSISKFFFLSIHVYHHSTRHSHTQTKTKQNPICMFVCLFWMFKVFHEIIKNKIFNRKHKTFVHKPNYLSVCFFLFFGKKNFWFYLLLLERCSKIFVCYGQIYHVLMMERQSNSLNKSFAVCKQMKFFFLYI